ncbi:hypothetical protein EDB19DRAFT_1827587 [Suillus lakei]|nr:hypothetical protein EDB19DRAFT_1827587 [Suillus lakei]
MSWKCLGSFPFRYLLLFIAVYQNFDLSMQLTLDSICAICLPLNPALTELFSGYWPANVAHEGGSIIVKQVRNAVLVLLLSGETEEYLMTLPQLHIDWLWYGSLYVELAETSYIQNSTGWLSIIEYKGEDHFSSKSHMSKAVLTLPSHIYTSSYVIEGMWHTTSKELHSGATFHDVTSPKEEIAVVPVEDQGG